MIFTDIYELVHLLEYMVGKPVYVVSYTRAKDKLINLKIIKSHMTERYTIDRSVSIDGLIECDATINIRTNYLSETYNISHVFLGEEQAKRYINTELSQRYTIVGDIQFVNYID